MRLAFVRHGLIHGITVFGNVPVVTEHEAAFHDIVAGHLGKAAVLP